MMYCRDPRSRQESGERAEVETHLPRGAGGLREAESAGKVTWPKG